VSEITLEKLHTLLQSLAEYVMTNVATRQELEQKADKYDVLMIKNSVDENKKTIVRLENKVDLLVDGMDAQAKQLDIIRTEQAAFTRAIDRHEERIAVLGDKTDYRIKETGESKYIGKKK
jgi:hypothetical protein